MTHDKVQNDQEPSPEMGYKINCSPHVPVYDLPSSVKCRPKMSMSLIFARKTQRTHLCAGDDGDIEDLQRPQHVGRDHLRQKERDERGVGHDEHPGMELAIRVMQDKYGNNSRLDREEKCFAPCAAIKKQNIIVWSIRFNCSLLIVVHYYLERKIGSTSTGGKKEKKRNES